MDLLPMSFLQAKGSKFHMSAEASVSTWIRTSESLRRFPTTCRPNSHFDLENKREFWSSDIYKWLPRASNQIKYLGLFEFYSQPKCGDKPIKLVPVLMTKMSFPSPKCGSCKRIVKVGDKFGIACDNCCLWYHAACASLSEKDVTLMAWLSKCLWLCDFGLNSDAFISEAMYNFFIDTKTKKSGMKSCQRSVTKNKSVLKSTPQPVKIHDNEKKNCLVR